MFDGWIPMFDDEKPILLMAKSPWNAPRHTQPLLQKDLRDGADFPCCSAAQNMCPIPGWSYQLAYNHHRQYSIDISYDIATILYIYTINPSVRVGT